MAVKPAVTARWAETAGGTPAANISVPSSGQRDTGWTNGQVPPSGIQNGWQSEVYQWIKYLSDGDLDGPIIVDGTLTADTVTADDFFYGASGASPHVLVIPAAAFSGNGSTSTVDTWVFSQATNGSFTGPHWEKIAATDVWISAPVLLDVGTSINNISLYQDRNGETVDFRLVQINMVTGARTVISTVSITVGSGRAGAALTSSLPHEIAANCAYHIEVDSTNSGSVVFGAVLEHFRAP